MAKILRIKRGYNPNSSSIGSETSGSISEVLRNAAQDKSIWHIITHHPMQALRYGVGILFGALLVFFVSKKLYYKIKLRNKNKTKKKNIFKKIMNALFKKKKNSSSDSIKE